MDITLLAQGTTDSASVITSKDIMIFIGSIIAGFLTYLGSRATARSQEKSKQIESSSPAWQNFVKELRDHHDGVITDLKKMHERNISEIEERHKEAIEKLTTKYDTNTNEMKKRLDALENEMKTVQHELGIVTDKYHLAVGYIQDIHEAIPEIEQELPVPNLIKEDINA